MDELIYLSRKAADQWRNSDAYHQAAVLIDSLCDRLEKAEPGKHGRWVPIEYDGYADGNPVWDLWECSECQEEHSGDEDTLTPYCPNCGAKMDGDGDA